MLIVVFVKYNLKTTVKDSKSVGYLFRCLGKLEYDSLFLLTLPSTTVLVRFCKTRFNVRQTLSAKKHPILQFLVSAPIQDFLCVLTDITVLGSNSHWVEPSIIARTMTKPKITAAPTIIAQMPLRMSLG